MIETRLTRKGVFRGVLLWLYEMDSPDLTQGEPGDIALVGKTVPAKTPISRLGLSEDNLLRLHS